jgi:hypothetical protein
VNIALSGIVSCSLPAVSLSVGLPGDAAGVICFLLLCVRLWFPYPIAVCLGLLSTELLSMATMTMRFSRLSLDLTAMTAFVLSARVYFQGFDPF